MLGIFVRRWRGGQVRWLSMATLKSEGAIGEKKYIKRNKIALEWVDSGLSSKERMSHRKNLSDMFEDPNNSAESIFKFMLDLETKNYPPTNLTYSYERLLSRCADKGEVELANSVFAKLQSLFPLCASDRFSCSDSPAQTFSILCIDIPTFKLLRFPTILIVNHMLIGTFRQKGIQL